MKKKTVVKNGVTYDFISEDQSVKFVCDICNKEKTSKNMQSIVILECM